MEKEETKVFLGGTIGGYDWRRTTIENLKHSYFNPVVKHWTEKARANEAIEKAKCNVHLYYINHNMDGVFSIVEAVLSSLNKKVITVIIIDKHKTSKARVNSFKAMKDIIDNENVIFRFIDTGKKDSISYIANVLNRI